MDSNYQVKNKNSDIAGTKLLEFCILILIICRKCFNIYKNKHEQSCIICAVVFIVVVVECLHSAGLAFNVLSSGLAFNVLSSGLAFNVLLLLHFSGLVVQCSGLVVQCAVIANSHPTLRPSDRPPKVSYRAAFAAKNSVLLVYPSLVRAGSALSQGAWYNLA